MIKLTAVGVMVFALSFFAVAVTNGQTTTPTPTPTTTITATPTPTGAVQGTSTTVPDAAPATGRAGL